MFILFEKNIYLEWFSKIENICLQNNIVQMH